ncbi:MAG: prepilin-type N-terminal cleavage/methylation domain-containing protein [Actinomycetota bacterium]
MKRLLLLTFFQHSLGQATANRYLRQSSQKATVLPTQSTAGFTLLEVIVVVLLVGVLSAIAAPSWEAFITRQRIRTVNDAVLRALQTAQSQAKLNKTDVSVVFTTTSDPAQVAIGSQTQTLSANGEIKPGQVKVSTQMNGATGSSITFSYQGTVTPQPVTSTPPQATDGFTVTVSTPEGTAKQCTIIQTILGTMRTAEGADCP